MLTRIKKEWKCEECHGTFEVGKWTCADGNSKHRVEKKTYLLNDAPSDPGHPAPGTYVLESLRDGRTLICGIPPDQKVIEGNETRYVPGGNVEFLRGRYSTTDPEVQYWLDKKGGFCGTYYESDSEEQKLQAEAPWEAAWWSDGQQLEVARVRLNAEKQRIENEHNTLLAEIQKLKKEKAGARA